MSTRPVNRTKNPTEEFAPYSGWPGHECDRGGVVRLADGGEIEADIIVGPTALILLCERACSALTRRNSPAVSDGRWRPLARAARHCH